MKIFGRQYGQESEALPAIRAAESRFWEPHSKFDYLVNSALADKYDLRE
jgi:hypothetical protein